MPDKKVEPIEEEEFDDIEDEDDIGRLDELDEEEIIQDVKDEIEEEVEEYEDIIIYNDEDDNKIDSTIYIVKAEDRITSEYLSLYEYNAVIGHRATHISQGAHIFIDYKDLTDPIQIAKKEIMEHKCPFSIKRKLRANLCELWNINEMIINLQLE